MSTVTQNTKAATALWTICEEFGMVDSAGGMEWEHNFPKFVEDFATLDAVARDRIIDAAAKLTKAMKTRRYASAATPPVIAETTTITVPVVVETEAVTVAVPVVFERGKP